MEEPYIENGQYILATYRDSRWRKTFALKIDGQIRPLKDVAREIGEEYDRVTGV